MPHCVKGVSTVTEDARSYMFSTFASLKSPVKLMRLKTDQEAVACIHSELVPLAFLIISVLRIPTQKIISVNIRDNLLCWNSQDRDD